MREFAEHEQQTFDRPTTRDGACLDRVCLQFTVDQTLTSPEAVRSDDGYVAETAVLTSYMPGVSTTCPSPRAMPSNG